MCRFVLIAVVAIIGCSRGDQRSPPEVAAPDPDRKIDERVLILQVLKTELSDLFQLARAEEVCFVLFGDGNPASRTDPPAECMKLLQGMRQKVVAGSAGEFRDSKYYDKTTGKAGVLLSIDFKPGKSEQDRVVSLGLRRHGLDGFGFSVRVTKKGNEWVVKEMFDTWRS